MTTFAFKALRADGGIEQGRLDAAGRQEAIDLLDRRGLRPIRIDAADAAAAPAPAGRAPRSRKVSASDLEDFTRSLSSLLAAGVPLSRALTILHRETGSAAARARWKEVHDSVVDGMSLAGAMGRLPGVFPRVYVAMVESGEAGGFLDVVLAQIAEFQAREKDLRARVTTALVYPAVLLVLALGVLLYLMLFFIPRFQILFEGFDAALPPLTRGIVAASHGLRAYGLWLVLGLALGVVALRNALTRDAGRRAGERLLLRTPGLGPLASQVAVARFCRMLGTLLGAGVPLMQCLKVARRSLGYQTLVDAVADSSERVQKGETLAAGLAPCRDLFPGSILEMISVAEESGRLDQELVRIAGDLEARLDRRLKTAVALAEPVMLFLIAGFIGIIFIGMVIPIFTIQDYIR